MLFQTKIIVFNNLIFCFKELCSAITYFMNLFASTIFIKNSLNYYSLNYSKFKGLLYRLEDVEYQYNRLKNNDK
jgi:hypothetical protein